MPLDPNIYQQIQPNLASQLAGSLNQFTEQRARLSDLARQREMQDVTFGQQQEQYGQQQVAAKAAAQQKAQQQGSLEVANILRSGMPIDQAGPLISAVYDKYKIPKDNLAQKLTGLYAQGADKAAFQLQREAFPEEAAKEEFKQAFAAEKPTDEGSPVTVMQQGKPMTIMSKSGRIVGEAVPTKALVNIGVGEPAPKVSPGTRVWQEGGEWKTEVMKGTPQWQALKSKEATDRAFVQNFVPSLEKNVQDIEKLTKHKGFDSIFGKVGGIASLDILPSTLEARAQLEQVVGAMETAGMQMQKSTAGSAGSMSQAEWPKMQTYLNLVKTATTPAQAKEALRSAVQSYQRMQEVGKESYTNEWGDGQFGDKTVIDRLNKFTKGHEKPTGAQAYEGDKEARYQAWKASQGR